MLLLAWLIAVCMFALLSYPLTRWLDTEHRDAESQQVSENVRALRGARREYGTHRG